MPEPQTYATHRRFDPAYHFLAFGLLCITLVLAIVHLFRQPGLPAAWMVLFSAAMTVVFFRTRTYPLKAQDRIIRLEETLRMERLLPEDLKPAIARLEASQIVALRFASDEELPDRVREAVEEGLDRETLKRRIRTWRPDTFRV